MGRPKKVDQIVEQVVQGPSVGVEALTAALVSAINATKPVIAKTANTRKPNPPWAPKDGVAKLKLKRKMYIHSIPIDPEMEANEIIELLNQVKPGRFMDGWVLVKRRRDRGVDLDWPIKTASQRLKLVNQFGIRNFKELLERCIHESENPSEYKQPDDLD